MLEIRGAEDSDFPAIWKIFHGVVSKGDTYTFPPDSTEEEARKWWMGPVLQTYVAVQDNVVVGTYYIKPNQPGLGSHVANAGYMVSPEVQAKGIGQAMAEHSLDEARNMGYRSMQFNFVVSTNSNAIALWKKLGFQIVGTLPKAFNHVYLGLVDAHVMFRDL